MAKEFSQFNKAGRKYTSKPATKKPDQRRTPSRSKQVARGKGFEHQAKRMAESARKAMKRGRFSAPGD